MAHQEFTGSQGPTVIAWDSVTLTGWQKITIAEKGKPLPEQLDKTHAGDATYQLMDHPLGGQGSASCSVAVEGLLSVTDHQDTGLLSKAVDGTGNLTVTTKAASDKFTMTAGYYKGLDVGAQFADLQPFKANFTLASSSGVWSTAA